jgi:hypothetical protein
MKAITLTSIAALCLSLTAAPLAMQAAPKPAKDAVVIAVSPKGDDRAAGTAASPFHTLERAQQAVRLVSDQHDVIVELADGTYRLARTLHFTAQDGGRNGYTVTWQAAADAHPVISGATPVTGWHPNGHGIFVVDVTPGVEARQLWVNDQLASIASEEIPRNDYTFTREGMTAKSNAALLNNLEGEKHLELRATGFFTERVSPIDHVDHGKLIMRQPAWDNNLWGYDTIEKPFHPELSHLYLVNSLKLLTKPGQWYLDSNAGKLYLMPNAGVDLSQADVELPHLTVLIAIGNSLDEPVRDLVFRGLRFSHTTWLGPASEEGYASQQSGSYMTGHALAYPDDPIATCAVGCRAFESMRNEWHQMPASIQVTASERITFDHDTFAHLGQYALGIGNDADATVTGTGLGAGDVTVTSNTFTDCAGGAILAGGVQRDAHHPRDPRMINRQLIVRNNRIYSVSREFRDNSAILSTYVQGAVILHNDISDVPYDAIDIGYGWGIQDAGGNPNYRVRMRGYDWPQNLVYQTPTTHRDVVVAANRIHDAKKLFHDGGAIYNLSASPGTLITENYIYDIHGLIALYLDEGSRYVTVRKNVVQDPGAEWLNINTVHAAYPLRISPDNTAIDNWHDSSKIGGLWTNYQNDLILDDHLITDGNWPTEAKEIMKNAGIEPETAPARPASTPQKSQALPD